MYIHIPRLTAHEVKVQISQMIGSKESQIRAIRNNPDPGDAGVAQDMVNALTADISLLQLMYSGCGETEAPLYAVRG